MLVRRGLAPRVLEPDLPFPPEISGPAADALEARLDHYAFRLFLRGALLLGPGPFSPSRATRYVGAAAARAMAADLVTLGLAVPAGRGRFRLLRPARTFGPTLEWYVARALRRRLGADVASGVRSGARGVGGDLDVVAVAEGKLLQLELKSSPPKHLSAEEVAAFLRRVRAVRPHVAVFAMDTALRLSDKVLPMFAMALGRSGGPTHAPRRVIREVWALTPYLYVTNARQDLIENLCRAIAEGLRALAPPQP
jgi:hypothetical protein